MREDKLVQPLHEREADAAPGAFYVVKDWCILCAAPVDTAPSNITWSKEMRTSNCGSCPDHCRVERQPQTAEEVAEVINAACYSCVAAIRYCGTDPDIIRTFKEKGHGWLCDAVERGIA